MASYYFTIDVPAKKDEIPQNFQSIDDIAHLYLEDTVVSYTHSRRNALAGLMAELAQKYN